MSGAIQLGPTGSEVTLTPYGRTYSEGYVEISKEDRTVNGTLVSDIVAVKKRFAIDYETLKGVDLEQILGLYQLQQELNLRVQERNESYSEYTVRMRPLDYERISILGDWEWGGVLIMCEEV